MINFLRKLAIPLFLIFGLLVSSILAYAQMSSFDGVIVFSREATPKHTSDIFILDGKSGHEHKLTSIGDNQSPALSPDRKYILFQSHHRPDTKSNEIYLMDIDGNNERRLTFTQGGNSHKPHWGINGEEIYFEAAIRGNVREYKIDLKDNKLFLIYGDADGSDILQVADMKAYISNLKKKDIGEIKKLQVEKTKQQERNQDQLSRLQGRYSTIPSPDGKYHILFYSALRKVELLDIAKGTKQLIGKEHDAGPPAWSKNSNHIAFFSGSLQDTRLWTYDIAKEKYEQYSVPANDNIGCNMPAWGKDDRFIAFQCGTPVSEENDQWIYIIDLQTRKSNKITRGDCPNWF